MHVIVASVFVFSCVGAKMDPVQFFDSIDWYKMWTVKLPEKECCSYFVISIEDKVGLAIDLVLKR